MHRLVSAVIIGAFVGCASLVNVIPPDAMTVTSIGETNARMNIYMQQQRSPPAKLDDLPKSDGYANSIVDGWGRPLLYTLRDDGYELTSFGKDRKPGGTAADADLVQRFRFVDGKSEEIRE